MWEPELILAQESPPLAYFTEAPMEVEENGAIQVQEVGALVEDNVPVEYNAEPA